LVLEYATIAGYTLASPAKGNVTVLFRLLKSTNILPLLRDRGDIFPFLTWCNLILKTMLKTGHTLSDAFVDVTTIFKILYRKI